MTSLLSAILDDRQVPVREPEPPIWQVNILPFLGIRPDRDLARRFHLTASMVRRLRQSLGIQPFSS